MPQKDFPRRLEKRVDKKYCIMDMDGTLVDSMRYWDRLSPEYLISRGINEDTDELMERIKTMTMPEALIHIQAIFIRNQ